jgi:hypothetical protein
MIRSRVDFFCGKRDQLYPFAPVPHVNGRFPRKRRQVTVTLPADSRFSAAAAFCAMEGTSEAFGYFVPEQEIFRSTDEMFDERDRRRDAGVGRDRK